MTSNTIKHLQYYVGKVCSIVTSSMNRSFDEKVSREHFVIRVQRIDQDGMWGCHPYNEILISFFNIIHVISIHEELELSKSNPDHAKMIDEFEKENGKELDSDLEKPAKSLLPILSSETDFEEEPGDATFVDILKLEALAEKSKKTFSAEDFFKN